MQCNCLKYNYLIFRTPHNSFYHSKSANSRIFDYLDSIKPDRVYKLFGRSYLILIEKNGHRYLIKEINKHYQPCELIDFIPDIAYFNTWYFPNETKRVQAMQTKF